jgi:hypothetical protein
MLYQWGYVAEGQCDNCNVHTELWTHSASQVEYYKFAICVFCHASMIRNHLYSYQVNETDSANLMDLLHTNPIKSSDIYGEVKPYCVGCGNNFNEQSSIIDADDRYGRTYQVHEGCARICDYCSNSHIQTRFTYTYTRTHHGALGFSVVSATDYAEDLEGDSMCSTCIEDNNFIECGHCSRVGDSDYYHSFNSSDYCDSCYEDNVYFCDSCDENYWGDDGHDCSNGTIKEWDYKPDPVFFKHATESDPAYYLGLELEVENTRGAFETEEEADSIQEEFLRDRAYLKHDGSISEGFEIVTHPHTLEAIRSEFNWSVLDRLREDGFRSWNASESSCGIHVHVSRTAFGGTHRRRVADHKRDAHMLRFMKLIYDNQRQVERLAGRSSNRWANFADKGQLVQKVKHGNQENGRYSAINTDNYATLEVRVFKGSLKKERVLSALEFVTASVEYTRDLKVTSTNKALSWAKFVSYVVANEDIYPNLLSKMSDSLANETITN